MGARRCHSHWRSHGGGVGGAAATIRHDLREIVDADAAEAAGGRVAEAASAVPERGASAWPRGTSLGGKAFAGRHGVPHGRFAWAARRHPRAKRVFEGFYQEERSSGPAGAEAPGMVVSTDVTFFTPPSKAGNADGTAALWPHVDQNRHDPNVGDLEIYQGVCAWWLSPVRSMDSIPLTLC